MVTKREEWSLSLAAGPLFWCVALCFTCLCIAAFPARLSRWNAISILIVPAWGAFRTGQDLSPDDTLNDIYLRFVIILVSHITYVSFQHADRDKELEKKTKTKGSPWMRGYKLVFNARGVATAWEVPHLWPGLKSTAQLREPSTSEKKGDASKKSGAPWVAKRGRWAGIFARIGWLSVNFILICLWFEFSSLEKLGFDLKDSYAPYKASIVRRYTKQLLGTSTTTPVSKEELIVRAREAAGNFVPDYLMLSAYHDFFALVFLILGVDESWEWPPLCGQITKAYNMRRFWSMFWHKLIYRSFNSHAAVICNALGINRRTAFSRILCNCLVFFLSGLMHGAVLWQFEVKCAWSASMRYWLLQPVAFVLEGVVQYVWGKFKRRSLNWVNPTVLTVFERIVGYAWVVTWLMWESTKRSFALAQCNRVDL